MRGSMGGGLVAVAQEGSTFWLPPQSSTLAPAHDHVFYFIYWVSVVSFVLVVGAMIYFVVRFRRRSVDQRTHPIQGHIRLELLWSVIPAIFLLAMFLWGFREFVRTQVPPADALEVRVTAQRWSWTYTYPTYGFDSEELVVPVNTPVRLTMRSTDVLHSFFVPEFRVKRDVLPNRYTVVWFEATREGSSTVLCTEYCGQQHSAMISNIRVVSQGEFENYVNSLGGMADLSPEQFGERLFQIRGCVACHNVSPEATGPTMAPSLWGVYGHEVRLTDGSTVIADDNYLRRSILNPNADIVVGYTPGVMPSFAGSLTEVQVDALIDYIKTLREGGGAH
jgi:cytochrome c oxidase subunit II